LFSFKFCTSFELKRENSEPKDESCFEQLRLEQRRGRVFGGWQEGRIYFPPTYKYSKNSDTYAVADQKEKRRTPAW